MTSGFLSRTVVDTEGIDLDQRSALGAMRPVEGGRGPTTMCRFAIGIVGEETQEFGVHLTRGARLVLVATSLAALTACDAAGSEPAGLSTETAHQPDGPATSPVPSASTGATTTAPPVSAAVPADLPPGLVFESIPEPTGPAAAALEAYLGFEAARWRTFLDAQVSADLRDYATDEQVARFESSVEGQRNTNLFGGGTMVLAPTIDRTTDQLVLIGGCADLSGLTNIVDGEEATPEEVTQSPRRTIQAIVAVDESTGRWKVSEYELEPGTC